MVNRRRRFVTYLRRVIRPACRGLAMSDKLALSDMIRRRLDRVGKVGKFGPEGSGRSRRRWRDAPRRPRRRKTPREARSDAAVARAARPAWRWPAVGRTQSSAPSDPKGRPPVRLLDGAGASDSDASRSASAGPQRSRAPSPRRTLQRRPGGRATPRPRKTGGASRRA